MRTPVGRAVLRGVAAPLTTALAGIVLRIEFRAVAGGLSLLAWIIVLIESGPACAAAAMLTGRARAGYDIGNEADAADEGEKCAEAG